MVKVSVNKLRTKTVEVKAKNTNMDLSCQVRLSEVSVVYFVRADILYTAHTGFNQSEVSSTSMHFNKLFQVIFQL